MWSWRRSPPLSSIHPTCLGWTQGNRSAASQESQSAWKVEKYGKEWSLSPWKSETLHTARHSFRHRDSLLFQVYVFYKRKRRIEGWERGKSKLFCSRKRISEVKAWLYSLSSASVDSAEILQLGSELIPLEFLLNGAFPQHESTHLPLPGKREKLNAGTG